jgi:hypothetical protein
MMRKAVYVAVAGACIVAAAATLLSHARADPQVERGKYLVVLAGCNDCHTPGFFLGKLSRRIGRRLRNSGSRGV